MWAGWWPASTKTRWNSKRDNAMGWRDELERLAPGQKERTDCECAPDRSLIISNDGRTRRAYCFRCGTLAAEPVGKLTLEELARIKEINDRPPPSTLELPDDFTPEIPLEGRLWLYKASLDPTRWGSLGFGWSEHYRRVVMPVTEAGKLVFFQMRAVFPGQTPKYLSPAVDRTRVVYEALPERDLSPGTCVVTEDILSAVRVGRFVPGYSLLGTKTTPAQLARLARYRTVKIWLDPDQAGKDAAAKLRKSLAPLTDTVVIRSDKDPKLLSDAEIRGRLQC